jgi:bifunctional UDP-N-acetylglucosamine pyrophosphorylase/glucosamine-1-phosphate N-acetyltransferase
MPNQSSTKQPRIAIAIMAAGKGTRLKSKHPKVLHEVGGKPLLAHVIAAAKQVLGIAHVYAIIGHEADNVRAAVESTGVNFVLQAEQRGTGHALMVARDALSHYDHVVVLSGDAPLITPETIRSLRDFHLKQHPAMTLLATELQDPTGYGRVLRTNAGSALVKHIVEEKDATPAQRKIREINSGFYAFDVKELYGRIDKLQTSNASREYYLTDMAEIFTKAKQKVVAARTDQPFEILGCNTRAEMMKIDEIMRTAKCRQLMDDGVSIYYPRTCVIDSDIEIGSDTVIEPYVQLLGDTRIGSDCRIRSYSVIRNTQIGDGVNVLPGCVMDDSRIDNSAIIGPYSRLRPGSDIGEGAHVGNFVETKKTRLGKGSKANHLTYLGDTEVGEKVNVGAGTITCNYDGVNKFPTVIGDGVFVGSDATLVAPVRIGKGAYIAAATCVTEDVPDDSLVIARTRQSVKEGWAKTKREARAAAKAKTS